MIDPASFRSGLLPTEHFDTRFSDANLAFWVPRLVKAASIDASRRVLDVGCGTGGFAAAIADSTSASITGLDQSEAFVEFARQAATSANATVDWVVGDAASLPFDDASFDRVLLSLVLHQLPDPERAIAEAFRVLVDGGLVLVRTIAPEDAPARVPARYLPSMAAADVARMPPIERIERWLEAAGFENLRRQCVLRNAALNLDDEERHVRTEVASRYPFIGDEELQEGLRRLRTEARAHAAGWSDPRPTYFLKASR